MATIGKLIFEMSANVARLQEDMGKARSTVESAMEGIKGAAATAKHALEAVGLGLGAMEFVHMVHGAIEAQDALYKLSQRTGVAVETLSGLRLIAKQSGLDMDTTATLINRLQKSMFQLATEPTASKQMQAAFSALGYSAKDVENGLKNIEVFLPDLAKRLTETGTASQQATLATVLLGRSGAQALPFLHQLAEAGQIHADVTTEQARRAQEFNDKLQALSMRSEEFKERLANQLMPTLMNVANAFIGVTEKGNGASSSISAITTFLRYATTAAGSFWLGLLDLGDSLGAFAAQANALLHGNLAAFREIGAERDRQLAANEAAMKRFQQQILAPAPGETGAAADHAKALDIGALVAEKGRGGAAKSPYESALEGLKQQLFMTEQRTATEKVLFDIEQKRYGDLTKNQQDELVRMAAQIDLAREQHQSEQQAIADFDKQTEAQKQHQAQLDQEAESIRRLLDPTRTYKEELEKINELLQTGTITMDEATQASIKVSDQMDEALNKLNKKTSDANDIGKQLGLTMSSAFEKAATGGESFRKVLQGLDRDIAQIILRKTVTEPMASAVSDAVSGSGAGDWISNIFSNIFGGGKASGGPVTAGTAYLVGESGPELFAPSSSGTIVPNGALAGGDSSGGVNVNFNINTIDARGFDALLYSRRDMLTGIIRQAYNQRAAVTPMG